MIKTTLHINPAKTLSYIAPEIYGQFSEHLGRCIYDGIYVGEIPRFLTRMECATMLWMRFAH